jgi:hypothetical protein
MSRFASSHRHDDEHRPIVDTLERLGFACLDLSGVGGGAPDLLVADRGQLTLVEIKTAGTQYAKRLRDSQRTFAARWPVPVVVLDSPESALAWAIRVRAGERA